MLRSLELGPTNPTQAISTREEVYNLAYDGASLAASGIVNKGLWAYIAVSMATLVAEKVSSGMLGKLVFVGAVGYAANQYLQSGSNKA